MRPSGVRIRLPGCGSACSSPVSSSWRHKAQNAVDHVMESTVPSKTRHMCMRLPGCESTRRSPVSDSCDTNMPFVLPWA